MGKVLWIVDGAIEDLPNLFLQIARDLRPFLVISGTQLSDFPLMEQIMGSCAVLYINLSPRIRPASVQLMGNRPQLTGSDVLVTGNRLQVTGNKL